MAHYSMKYKGEYRVLPVLDEVYHDLPRDTSGNIIHEEVELYIACKNGNKITEYGKDSSNRMVLQAYIPSIGRGRNIKKALDAAKKKLEAMNGATDLTDEEIANAHSVPAVVVGVANNKTRESEKEINTQIGVT